MAVSKHTVAQVQLRLQLNFPITIQQDAHTLGTLVMWLNDRQSNKSIELIIIYILQTVKVIVCLFQIMKWHAIIFFSKTLSCDPTVKPKEEGELIETHESVASDVCRVLVLFAI